jgi:DNA-directed RNA polymerase specialized sigma24 family protein
MTKGDFTDRDSGSRDYDFESFLKQLDPSGERATEAFDRLRRRLVKFFEWNRMPAEDLASETLEKVVTRLRHERVSDVTAFAHGVARSVLAQARQKSARERGFVPESDSVDPEQEIVDYIDQLSEVTCLRGCLAKLKAEDRGLVLEYYNGEVKDLGLQRRALADKNGMSINTLRVRVIRIREMLRQCLVECMTLRKKRLAVALEGSPEAGEPKT